MLYSHHAKLGIFRAAYPCNNLPYFIASSNADKKCVDAELVSWHTIDPEENGRKYLIVSMAVESGITSIPYISFVSLHVF
jgi:hypothetical protein